METLIEVESLATAEQPRRMRVLTLLTLVALIVGCLAIARAAQPSTSDHRSVTQTGVPAIDGLANTIGHSLGFGAPVPQINTQSLISSIVCPIFDSLATGPLASILGPIINSLRALFGCTSP